MINMPYIYQGAIDFIFSALPVVLLFLGVILAFVFLNGLVGIFRH